jgi:hypothetical protein
VHGDLAPSTASWTYTAATNRMALSKLSLHADDQVVNMFMSIHKKETRKQTV